MGEEEKNVKEFSEKLAAPFDMYVNDAFGTAHRAHSSTAGVTEFLKPSVSGFLLQKELDYLDGAVSNPKRPFAAIVGGSKVSSKIGVIESLMAKCDKLVIGGGMVFTFLKAKGLNTGSSLVEDDKVALATELMKKAADKGVNFILPTDVVLADKFCRCQHQGRQGRGHRGRLDGSRQRPRVDQDDPEGARRAQDHHLERPHGRVRDGEVRRRHQRRGQDPRRVHRQGRHHHHRWWRLRG